MTVKSPHPAVEIPDVPLHEFVLEHASRLGDKPALIDGPSGRTVSYAQLSNGAAAVARGLQNTGFEKGDVFAIFSPNLPEYAIAYYGVQAAGGANTTINPLYTAEELAFQLKDAGAKFLLTIPQFLDRALEAASQSPVKEVFVFGEAEGATPFAELLSRGDSFVAPSFDVMNDIAAIPYSSGTTGFPKGVMMRHHGMVANLCQVSNVLRWTERDVLVAVLPFFHIFGQGVIMNMGLRRGTTLVVLPRFDLEEFLRTIQDYKVTWAFLVPPIILALAKHPLVDQFDLSSLEVVISGAAPLGREVQEAVEARLGCEVRQGYGMTEIGPGTHVVPEGLEEKKFGSVGVPVPNTEVKVVDIESGNELGPNERGELWIRGPQIMKGYLNNAEATAHTIDNDGFLHTGDIGYVDDEGYFYIVDRLKELIKYKGFQVPPAELEALLITHPAITDVAVIGAPDEEAGELPKAFIVRSGDLTEEDVISWVAEKVAPQKKVRLVEFVDEIPKAASGKILRRVLVEQERARLSQA